MIWLKEVDSIALQSSLKNLADAYSRFFKKQNDAPRFKSKKNRVQSYTTRHTNGNIAIEGNKIKLPKLGLVNFARSREVEVVFSMLPLDVTHQENTLYLSSLKQK